MGVVNLPTTNITVTAINNLSAEAKLRNSSGYSGNTHMSIDTCRGYGVHTRMLQSNGVPFRGTNTNPGFRINPSSSLKKHRFLIIYGENCTVGVSSPSVCKGVLYKAGSSPSFEQTSINSANSASGYKLYLSGINYNDYSSITITASSFSYGYSAGSWVWYTESGGFVGAVGSGTTSQTLYASSYTGTSYAILKHVAG